MTRNTLTQPTPDETKTVLVVTHYLPLRPDLTVPITLPVDLTEAEATRLVGIIRTLAFGVSE